MEPLVGLVHGDRQGDTSVCHHGHRLVDNQLSGIAGDPVGGLHHRGFDDHRPVEGVGYQVGGQLQLVVVG